MSKKEGKHYDQRKSKSKGKEFYSVRTLVEEITGISQDDQGFEAAYKEVQRIIKTFQSQEGIDEGTLKIHKDMKQSFVKATKAFYEDVKYRDLLAKIRKEEQLTIEEHDILIEHFLESMIDEMPEEEKKKVRQTVESMKEEEYFEKAEKIREIMKEDIDLVDEIKHYPTKLQYMNQYMEILESSLRDWRENIKNHILYQRAYERVVKKEPHLLTEEPLSNENMTPEILTKIMMEILLINQEDK